MWRDVVQSGQLPWLVYAGPAIVLSYVMAGLACGFAALCYAEFAAMIPISGSAYTYAYATLGEICDELRGVYGAYEEPTF